MVPFQADAIKKPAPITITNKPQPGDIEILVPKRFPDGASAKWKQIWASISEAMVAGIQVRPNILIWLKMAPAIPQPSTTRPFVFPFCIKEALIMPISKTGPKVPSASRPPPMYPNV